MVKKSKRAPGGGRKSKGPITGKTQVFTTRITANTRDWLQREAEALDQSVSQVAERLLRLGLYERRQRRTKDRRLRAISYLIQEIADRLNFTGWLDPTSVRTNEFVFVLGGWRTDPFRYRAFKIAVGHLLGALEPPGEIKSPIKDEEFVALLADKKQSSFDADIIELIRQQWKSPESLAASVFSDLWQQLNRSQPVPEPQNKREEMIAEELYAVAAARADLGLDKKDERS